MTRGFDEAVFRRCLTTLGLASNRVLTVYKGIDSTSNELHRQLTAGANSNSVIVADYQSNGRGRKGRFWHSPQTGNLYISMGIEVHGPPSKTVPMIPLVAGISAADALQNNSRVECLLKWPNDLLVSDRKIAGILCETHRLESNRVIAIVGLGINIASTNFPEELINIATSVPQETGEHPPLEPLAADWVYNVESWLPSVEQNLTTSIIGTWRKKAEPFGRFVRVGDICGTTKDLAPDGRLILITPDGAEIAIAGGVVENVIT